jgi:hypothetical protein
MRQDDIEMQEAPVPAGNEAEADPAPGSDLGGPVGGAAAAAAAGGAPAGAAGAVVPQGAGTLALPPLLDYVDEEPPRKVSIMDKVANVVNKKTHAKQAGEVLETDSFKKTWVHKTTRPEDHIAPVLPGADAIPIRELIPHSEREDMREADSSAIANKPSAQNLIEFVMVTKTFDALSEASVQLPGRDIFHELACKANWRLMTEKPAWCLVVQSYEVNDSGVGIISLNYQDPIGAEKFRDILRSFSTTDMMVETYPVSTILKRYALSVYLHRHHPCPTQHFGEIFALCNPGLKGKMTVIDVKEIKGGPRAGSRVFTLEGDEEFLQCLSQYERNHRFRLANKKFFINGGARKDSSSAVNVPDLPRDQVYSLLQANLDKIVANARERVEEHAKFLESRGLNADENLY